MQRRETQDRPEVIQVSTQRHISSGTVDAAMSSKVSPKHVLTERDGGAASSIHRAKFSLAYVAPVTCAGSRGTPSTM